jgi:hypothetical protein
MKQEAQLISFKLSKITTEEFASFKVHNVDSDFRLSTELKFGIEQNERFLAVIPSFTYFSKEIPFLKISVGCQFQIEEDGWLSMLDSAENKLVLNIEFIRHLTVIAIGTARGVLHAKTENTEFNKYFLPTINVEELLTQELVVNLKD